VQARDRDLDGDGALARRAPAPELGWHDDLGPTVFAVRHVSILALAGCAALIPAIGPDRTRIAFAVLFLVLPWDLAMHWWSRRHGRLPSVMPFANAVIGGWFVGLAPTTFVPALLVLVSDIGLAAAVFGRRVASMAVALTTVLVGIASMRVGDGERIVGLLGYVIAASGLVIAVGALFEDERRLRGRHTALLSDVDAVLWEATAEPYRFTYVSEGAREVLGYPPSAWADDEFWSSHLHPDDRARVLAQHTDALATGRDYEREYRMHTIDGRVVHLRDRVTVVGDATGAPVRLRGVITDVTAQRRAEERVRQYADLVEHIQMALLVVRLEHDGADSFRIVAANPKACELSRTPDRDIVGRRLLDAFPRFGQLGLHEQLATVVRRGEPYDLDDITGDGDVEQERHFSVHAFPLGERLVGVSLDDVTGRSLAAKALRRQATHDGLTGLPNRALLQDRLRQAVRTAARNGTPVALLMMDLDQFKEINDALGHHAGDRLLVEMARRLEQVLRDTDTVARLGGDEFAILLTSDATEQGALTVAGKITTALEAPFDLDGLSVQTNASIGIALFPDHADDHETLTKRADIAMYRAKRAARPYAVYDAEHDRSSVKRVTMLGELRRAIDLDELLLVHQPAFDLRTGAIAGTEALVRWQHPVHGLMTPGEFVDLAEVSGMIQPLTRWAIRTAMRDALSWAPDGGAPTIGVAINLSVRNLYDPELTSWLRDALDETAYPPSLITLEITESEVMDDPMLAVEVLGRLHELGVHTSIDDFGTGQSSLAYLKHLPIDELKIDRSFVAGMATKHADETIVRSIIDLGHALGLRVVAEGVENDDMVRRLRALDCDRAQGFHLSKPLSANDVTRVLRQELPLRIVVLRR